MYRGRTCGPRSSAISGTARSWKSCQTSACSRSGFMPGNGDGIVQPLHFAGTSCADSLISAGYTLAEPPARPVPLFGPRVAAHVIAAVVPLLPKTGTVAVHELDAPD